MNTRKIALVTALLAGALASGLAKARGPDVQWSVNIGLPLPQVVVRLPILLPPGVVVTGPAPAPVYREPTRWDVYGDGIPNRYDNHYNPRWDRDGDGIPNRYDHHYNPRCDRRDDRRDYRDDRRYDRRDYREDRREDRRDDWRGWDSHRH